MLWHLLRGILEAGGMGLRSLGADKLEEEEEGERTHVLRVYDGIFVPLICVIIFTFCRC